MQSYQKTTIGVVAAAVLIFVGGGLALHFGQKSHDTLDYSIEEEFPEDAHVAPGEVMARTLIEIVDHELHGTFGWRPNDFFLWGPGLWADNNANRQIGIIQAIRETARVFKDNLTKVSADVYDKNLLDMDNLFRHDEKKFAFPSAEKSFSEAVEALERYVEGLHADPPTSRFLNLRHIELIKLFEIWTDLLGDAHANLHRTEERDGSPVRVWRTDNYFYVAQGSAHVMYYMMQAVEREYGRDLQQSVRFLFNEVLEALAQAATLKPLVVLDGAPAGLLANHRKNLDSYISEARDKMFSIKEELEK